MTRNVYGNVKVTFQVNPSERLRIGVLSERNARPIIHVVPDSFPIRAIVRSGVAGLHGVYAMSPGMDITAMTASRRGIGLHIGRNGDGYRRRLNLGVGA
jgi:hypothetical protein